VRCPLDALLDRLRALAPAADLRRTFITLARIDGARRDRAEWSTRASRKGDAPCVGGGWARRVARVEPSDGAREVDVELDRRPAPRTADLVAAAAIGELESLAVLLAVAPARRLARPARRQRSTSGAARAIAARRGADRCGEIDSGRNA
jgi:hypothetical protein